jgi:hypothetical protein
MFGYWLFTEATTFADFVISQRSQPETFADNMWFDFEGVFRTGLEKAEEIFDDRGSSVVSFKVYEPLTVNRWRVDEGRLLRIVDKIARVNACRLLVQFVVTFGPDSPMKGMQPSSTVAVSISSRRL